MCLSDSGIVDEQIFTDSLASVQATDHLSMTLAKFSVFSTSRVKNMVLPSRLKSVKKPHGPPPTEGEKKKRHFKQSTTAKRRQTFYTTGKGSVGLLVRYPRLVRNIRRIRKDQNKRFEELTGIVAEEGASKKIVLFRSFPEAAIGAIDSYANRVMELAADHAKTRRSGKKPKVGGLKLRIEDIQFAIRWIRKISSE